MLVLPTEFGFAFRDASNEGVIRFDTAPALLWTGEVVLFQRF
jgi:hypothetical protein